ncbi:hypothetical protein HUU59_12295 [bacterium]|nr:hypothetical protein [bacterium]
MNSNISRSATVVLVVLAGALTGFALWNLVSVPYDNPTGTFGPLAKAHFSQRTNTLRYIVFLIAILSCMTLAAAVKLIREGFLAQGAHTPQSSHAPGLASKNRLYAVLACLVLALAAHYHYLESSPGGTGPTMDHYHHGLVAATVVAAEHGLEPYIDFYPTRGILVDVTKSTAAFALFGRSESSLIIMDSLLHVFAYCTIAFLFLVIFNTNYLAAALCASLLLCFTVAGYVLPSRFAERDAVYALLAALFFLLPRTKSTRSLGVVSFLLAFLPPFAYAVALDKGIISTAIYAIAFPVILALLLQNRLQRFTFLLSSFAGASAGILTVGWLINWHYSPFLSYVFRDILAYRGYVEGLQYLITTDNLRATLYRMYALLIQASVAAWIFYQLLQAETGSNRGFWDNLKEFIRDRFSDIMFALLALTAFLYALNHSDRAHIATGASWSTIFLLYVVVKYHLPRLKNYRLTRPFEIGLTAIAAFVGTAIYVTALMFGGGFTRAYPVGYSDDDLLTDEYRETLSYLKTVVNAENLFVSLTNEGSWYYLLDQPCPVVFSEIWLASSRKFQELTISQFETKPIEYVLYQNDAVWKDIGGVSVKERVPMIFQYVDQNFVPHKTIGSQQIWVHK